MRTRPGALFAQSAFVAAVAAIQLLVFLAAGQLDRAGVDDDDVIAGVDVRRVNRLVLALQQARGERRHAAEHLALASMTCHRLSALFALATNVRMKRVPSGCRSFSEGSRRPELRVPHWRVLSGGDGLQPETPMIRTVAGVSSDDTPGTRLRGDIARTAPASRCRGISPG